MITIIVVAVAVLFITVAYLLYKVETQSNLNIELAKYAVLSGSALDYLKQELDALKGKSTDSETKKSS